MILKSPFLCDQLAHNHYFGQIFSFDICLYVKQKFTFSFIFLWQQKGCSVFKVQISLARTEGTED